MEKQILNVSKLSGGIVQAKSAATSWDRVTSCKHWFPCDGLESGRLVDVKGGVIVNPQSGYAFEYDGSLGTVRSTAGFSAARESLHSGSFETLPANKFILVFYAGYVEDVPYNGSIDRFMRVAIGDTASTTLAGLGTSDGDGGSSGASHTLFVANNIRFAASHSQLHGLSAGDAVFDVIGDTGHFFRYSLMRPDTLEMEGAIRRTDTGAVLQNNATQYGTANPGPLPDAVFADKFRMSGSKQTVIGVFHFDSVPADYLLAMQSMAAWSRDGYKAVWPYWD